MVNEHSDFVSTPAEAAGWQAALSETIRSPGELCRLLGLDAAVAAMAEEPARRFPVLVPRTILDRIGRGDWDDPILRQVLPHPDELVSAPGFSADPVGEVEGALAPGLLQKYPGRSLIVATSRCGVHCRYCFRRHFPFASSTATAADWEPALAQLARDTSIREVILSGGDPLTLPDAELSRLAGRLAAIPHLRRLRIHTRLPVVVPSRVNQALIGWMRGTRLTSLVVVQVNHAAELDDAAEVALGQLVDAGIPLLCQSVLLRGVNDSADALVALFERLIDLRIAPYYLHQLDRVAGAAHFEVSEDRGRALMAAVRARLPGYAVPRYVRQPLEGPCKRVLA
jgi:EF-P beta-lysylation protein EpmB